MEVGAEGEGEVDILDIAIASCEEKMAQNSIIIMHTFNNLFLLHVFIFLKQLSFHIFTQKCYLDLVNI